jgi:hypothetical protein
MKKTHERRGPELQELLTTAAEMRAEGAGWEAIAAKVRRSADTVRRWPQRHAALWQRLFREAEERLVAEASAESVLVLRRSLRDPDDKVRREVARTLVTARTARRRQEKKTTAEPTDDRERVAAFLAGQDEAALRRMLEELLTHAIRNSG